MVDPMQTVEAAARALKSSFIAGVKADAQLQVDLAELQVRELLLETEALRFEAEKALHTFNALLKKDIALLAFAEAMTRYGVVAISDVSIHAADIRSTANRVAGFDIFSVLDAPEPDEGAEPGEQGLDAQKFQNALVHMVASKLARTSLALFTRVARMISNPELGHSLRTHFEKLEALVRRIDTTWDDRLRHAGHLYLESKLEIPEIARLVGLSPSDVAADFERLGFHRSIEAIRLSPEERAARLAKLSQRGATGLVERDVVASQRIEGIDARSHLPRIVPQG